MFGQTCDEAHASPAGAACNHSPSTDAGSLAEFCTPSTSAATPAFHTPWNHVTPNPTFSRRQREGSVSSGGVVRVLSPEEDEQPSYEMLRREVDEQAAALKAANALTAGLSEQLAELRCVST